MSTMNSKLTYRLYIWIVGILVGLLSMWPDTMKAEEIFHALTANKNVESTYVSGRIAKDYKIWQGSMNRSSIQLPTGFSSLYSYRCYSKEAVEEGRKILKDYLKDNKDVELVMSTNDHTGEYQYYLRYNGNDHVTQALIWNCMAPNDCEIVVVYFSPQKMSTTDTTSPSTSSSNSSIQNYTTDLSTKDNEQPGMTDEEYRKTQRLLQKQQDGETVNFEGQSLEGYILRGDWNTYLPIREKITRIIENQVRQQTDEEAILKYVEDALRETGIYTADELQKASERAIEEIRNALQRTK